MTWVPRQLAILVPKSGHEKVHIFENRRQQIIVLIIKMMSKGSFNEMTRVVSR
jgi:hypothetical protein